MNLRDHPTKK